MFNKVLISLDIVICEGRLNIYRNLWLKNAKQDVYHERFQFLAASIRFVVLGMTKSVRVFPVDWRFLRLRWGSQEGSHGRRQVEPLDLGKGPTGPTGPEFLALSFQMLWALGPFFKNHRDIQACIDTVLAEVFESTDHLKLFFLFGGGYFDMVYLKAPKHLTTIVDLVLTCFDIA